MRCANIVLILRRGGVGWVVDARNRVRAKAANRKRVLSELEPGQPEPGSRLEWQAGQDADTALEELPQDCDWGTKRDAHGKPRHWKGGKIHAAVTDDGIPVAIAYTSASLHDSQAMIPLMKKASERVPHIHDLADAAYDSETIRESSVEEGNQSLSESQKSISHVQSCAE